MAKEKKTSANSFRPHDFVECRSDLSYTENMILDIILALINNEDESCDEKLEYTINLKDFAPYMGYKNNKSAFMFLRQGAEGLYSKDKTIITEKEVISFRFLQEMKYHRTGSCLAVMLSNSFKKDLIARKKASAITFYPWKYSISLSSRYSQLLYYFFKSFAGKVRYDNVSELAEKLDYPIATRQYGSFKRDILKCIGEINEKTDLNVTFHEKEPVGSGRSRKIEVVFFEIDKKDLSKKPAVKSEHSSESLVIQDIFTTYNIDIDDKSCIAIAKAAEKNGLDMATIKRRINMIATNAGKKKNIIGACIHAMGPDFIESRVIGGTKITPNFTERDKDWNAIAEELSCIR